MKGLSGLCPLSTNIAPFGLVHLVIEKRFNSEDAVKKLRGEISVYLGQYVLERPELALQLTR